MFVPTRAAISLLVAAAFAAAAPPPAFREHLIASDLKGGYQVVPFDVNRDGRVDLIALASGMPELVWFENPGWERHVLARGLNRMINLAACAGMEEIVVAHEFANVPKNSIGIVSVLTPGPDRSQPWSVREIDRLTTSHRLRCAVIDKSGKPVVINAVLAGAKAEAPDYKDHAPLVYYRPGEWKRVLINEANEGVVHGILITPWLGRKGPDCVITASFLGLHVHCPEEGGRWSRTLIHAGDPAPAPKSGSSDVALGHLGHTRFLAAIEPWHGDQVTIYREGSRAWSRQVIDRSLVDGHTIVTADLDGDGRDEVIAGYRGKGRSVYLYSAKDKRGDAWEKTILDDGGIAAAACVALDLNGDKRPDIACIGSATTNLKWYENSASQK
jgi:hypothetical protein